jgi:hypothetical protein
MTKPPPPSPEETPEKTPEISEALIRALKEKAKTDPKAATGLAMLRGNRLIPED